jgi:hypothetical protein
MWGGHSRPVAALTERGPSGGFVMRWFMTGILALVVVSSPAGAQQSQRRPASPDGTSATQVNGKWIEILYGRPILRGRTNIYGGVSDYGQKLFDGGTVWRAGANVSTRLRTEAALEVGGKRVAPGEYVMLIDLKGPNDWTLILTSQPYTLTFDPKNTKELYGGYNYRPDHDVARAGMKTETLPFSVDQLTWAFTDVTPGGGTMRVAWERVMASAPFKILE